MNEKINTVCALCGVTACDFLPGTRKAPPFCPMHDNEDILEEVKNGYIKDREINRLAIESARTEARGYCRMTRIEETMDFASNIGASKLGIAHCIGLKQEAKLAYQIFCANGFEVYTVCCKVGSIDKEAIGLEDNEKVNPGNYEPACNPIGQAAVLSQLGTHLNVVIGLCVGHDSMFFAHSKAPTTVLVAKDRVLGHNPVAALYTTQSYYSRLRKKSD